jgi:hypothetical protein
MIKNLVELQKKSKNFYFASRLTAALIRKNIELSPAVVSIAFNKHYKVKTLKPHTVRKWLLGLSLPRTEMLLLISEWLSLQPQDLLSDKNAPNDLPNNVSFEFDFTDQEVISRYLSMTLKQKVTVRLVIDAIAEQQRGTSVM